MNCPICARALTVDPAALERGQKPPAHFPFCGERCKLIDLGRWATGKYAIPGDPVETTPVVEDA